MKGDGIPLTPASGPLLPRKDSFAGLLEDAQRDARSHRRTEFLARFQVPLGYLLRPENLFRRLRTRADDERIGNRPQAPTGCDAFDLLRGAAAIAAGADQRGVRPAIEPIERRIVG